MTNNTGLLTQRCDPFGAESEIKLLGGMYPEAMNGKQHWFCKQPAAGRFRMICTGGDYGFRRGNDGGLVKATHCDGGHRGQIMPLCRSHVSEFSVGPPPPGFDKSMRPRGRVGGTKANELCPACAFPPEARELTEKANHLQGRLSQLQAFGLMGEMARLQAEQDQVRARLDELHESGRIHKCPLILREVS
jgi:hypothetical protein